MVRVEASTKSPTTTVLETAAVRCAVAQDALVDAAFGVGDLAGEHESAELASIATRLLHAIRDVHDIAERITGVLGVPR